MLKTFPPEWLSWIEDNRARGCSEQELATILLKEGYDRALIHNTLGIEDPVDIEIPEDIDVPENVESVVQDQSILGSAMALRHYWLRNDWLTLPRATEIKGENFRVFTVADFLNPDECAALIAAIDVRNEPSTTTRVNEDNEFRTSNSAMLQESPDPVVHATDRRMASYLGINTTHAEFVQGQRYETGQQFKLHTDYFDDQDFEAHCVHQGQRTWTFMLYLNEPDDGGETVFPHAGIEIRPKAGMAVLWNNLDEYGVRNPQAMHQGMPVIAGSKYILTKWFRQYPYEPALLKEQNEFIPRYTDSGWSKETIPAPLFLELKTSLGELKHSPVVEHVPGGFLLDRNGNETGGSYLYELSDTLKQKTGEALKPLLEKWSGQALKFEIAYGIREYLEGSSLIMHRDRNATHIISVILNIDQDTHEDWDLLIDDHFYRTSRVAMSSGEMVFYEGARLSHGRPEPLLGKNYANLFVHYSPADGSHLKNNPDFPEIG